MMLPALENIPVSSEEWQFFAWHHRDSHDRIRAAVMSKYGQNLTDFQVEPISPDDFGIFLQNNSSLHTDMNAILGLQSTDIQDVDLQDEKQLQSWISLHYLEHYYAEAKLGI